MKYLEDISRKTFLVIFLHFPHHVELKFYQQIFPEPTRGQPKRKNLVSHEILWLQGLRADGHTLNSHLQHRIACPNNRNGTGVFFFYINTTPSPAWRSYLRL